MEERLLDGIADVFSILPDDAAKAATLDTVERLGGRSGDSLELIWGEFDNARRMSRGGLTQWPGGTAIHYPGNVPDALNPLQKSAESARPGDVRRMVDGRTFHWFAPHTDLTAQCALPSGVKGFVVSEAVFSRLVTRVEGEVGLSAAEGRLFFQIAAGLTVVEAADDDDVSIETKRSQMKALYGKLGCEGLPDLVRRSTGYLTHLVALCEADVREAAGIESFVTRHLDHDSRLGLQRMPSGRLLRFLEIGPPDGKPILVMHGMLFPVLLIGAAPHLKAAGLRLIVPIRHGYLDETPASRFPADGSLMSASLEDIATFARALAPRPIAVLGHSNGSPIALRFARLYPEIVDRLIILSMNGGGLHNKSNSFSHRFFTGLQRLSLKAGVFGLLSWQFNKFYGDIGFVKTVLRGLFGGCDDDWKLIEGGQGRAGAYRWFSEGYLASTTGVADDFRVVMGDWRADADAVRVPIRFLHGSRDALVDVSRVRALAASLEGATIDTFEAGHLACATKPSEVWTSVAAMLQNNAGTSSRRSRG